MPLLLLLVFLFFTPFFLEYLLVLFILLLELLILFSFFFLCSSPSSSTSFFFFSSSRFVCNSDDIIFSNQFSDFISISICCISSSDRFLLHRPHPFRLHPSPLSLRTLTLSCPRLHLYMYVCLSVCMYLSRV